VGLDCDRPALPRPPHVVILLDTNALIWVQQAHPRTRKLIRSESSLYISPAILLELQFLQEAGRIRLKSAGIQAIVDDDRWLVDDPPATAWFLKAAELGWTRDPFDRLIAAHAQLRGWRVATADRKLIEAFPMACVAL
jgi:PIN domain nuclease of toxin-antitoxin system